MGSQSSQRQFISPRAMTSQKLHGLILEIAEGSGLDQETLSGVQNLLPTIESPYLASIALVFKRQGSGWILSEVPMQHYSAGALPTEPRIVS